MQISFLICNIRPFLIAGTNQDFLLVQHAEKKILASVGVEPTTFALLARRSNRLS